MQIHPLITDSKTLAQFCARIAKSPYIAVDTDFMRENSYWPDLCLVQVADSNEPAAIDPKAPVIMLTGAGTAEREIQARQLGVTDFLAKGFSLHELGTALKLVLHPETKV